MKLFAAIVLVAAVASATPVNLADAIGALKPEPVAVGPAIVDADLSPIAIGPAIIENPQPVVIGPAWVDAPQPIAIGPAIIDFPLPDGGAVSAPVQPSPAIVIPGPVSPQISSGPLVQVVVNIHHVGAVPEPVAVGPAVVPEPLNVVEVAPEPVHVVEVAPPIPPIAVNPIGVVAPGQVQPAIIGNPVLPLPILH